MNTPTSTHALVRAVGLTAALLQVGFVDRAVSEEAEALPSFFRLYDEADGSSLRMTCRGSAPYQTLICNFIQLSVRKPSMEDTQRRKRELEEDLRALKMTDFLRQQESCAADVAKQLREVEKERHRYPTRVATAEHLLAMCSCSTIDCVRASMEKMAALSSGVCEASVYTYELELTRVGQARKWMNKAEPSGLCSMVTAIVVEEDSKGAWTYTQTRLAMDQTSTTCSMFQANLKSVYSSMLPPEITGCRVVTY